jgi:formate hydrogenlyase subunit 3/multisubunit Na+/H+ antiporter MnhD subunit
MGLGFALISAVFPFHTWIPMLAQEAHPYAAAFVFFILPAAIAFLGLEYLGRYSPLVDVATIIYTFLRYAGALMVITGGIWAAVQTNLGRILGFAALMQIGMGLLALSLGHDQTAARGIFFAQLLPQGVGLALWAQALCALEIEVGSLSFQSVKGVARRVPIVSVSLILATFSLAGFPLLANFPINVALWSELAQRSLPIAILSLAGCAGLFIAGLRTSAVLVMAPTEETWRVSERGFRVGLLLIGWAILFVIGMMPQWFFPSLTTMALTFTQP